MDPLWSPTGGAPGPTPDLSDRGDRCDGGLQETKVRGVLTRKVEGHQAAVVNDPASGRHRWEGTCSNDRQS